MTEKRFVQNTNLVMQNNEVYVVCADEHSADVVTTALNEVLEENEQLKQQLSDINGQLVMLDNCDNWDYDRMKHTVREIAEIIGYNGTINPKR